MKSLVLAAAAECLIMLGCAAQPEAGNPTPANNMVPTPTATTVVSEPVPTPRADEADDGRKHDFEGTAGITDKKGRDAGLAVLKAVRIARHGTFDRIVFEFSGATLPGYHVEYVDKPVRSCGSGDVVPLAGDGWLAIKMSPAAAHTDAGNPTIGAREFTPNLPVVRELKSTCDFEAEVEWVAGVASPNKYRVLELKDPTRLVVDIKH